MSLFYSVFEIILIFITIPFLETTVSVKLTSMCRNCWAYTLLLSIANATLLASDLNFILVSFREQVFVKPTKRH